ncbi:hypothetical protein LINPERPRIM_LOCUS33291 [Linum perenne]
MTTASKTRNMIEGFVKEGSFKWLLGKQTYFDEEFEEMRKSPSARSKWIAELSPLANIVVRRCSKILGTSPTALQESFNKEASNSTKHPLCYARNFLECCCFRALAVSIQVTGNLEDKKVRRLAFDMMLAWETPAATSQPIANVDGDLTVGLEAFSRIAPAVPLIANVVVSENLFQVLTMSSDGRLQFSVFDKYLSGLERAVKKMKSQSDSSLLSEVRSIKKERILEVEGTVTTQPVFEHVGASTWPGRLTLTDHALYFESLRVVSYDKPKLYDLSEDMKQVVKPELTGPWGTRLFDKAVSYCSISLFIKKFQLSGVARDEALSKAVLGILQLQAIQDLSSVHLSRHEDILMFNLCEHLPGGDLILKTLANMSSARELERASHYDLLLPAMDVGKWLLSLLYWDDTKKSLAFCLFFSFIIWRGWLGYAFALMFALLGVLMLVTRFMNQGRPVDELKVVAPPSMNTMEQLLAVQNAISQVEQLIQDGNICLLKVRALLLAVFPQASDKFALALLGVGIVLAILPLKYVVLLSFLEVSTMYSPPRKDRTERCERRMREWWFSIPAAPVVLDKVKDDKKKK